MALPGKPSGFLNFGLFNQAVSGKSDFDRVTRAENLGERLYKLDKLCMDPDWHLIPVIEGSVTRWSVKGSKKQLRLVGLDLLALGIYQVCLIGHSNFRRYKLV